MIPEIPPDLLPAELREFGQILNSRIRMITQQLEEPAVTATLEAEQIFTNFSGTHATRIARYPASKQKVGAQFFETDRTVTYVVTKNGPAAKKWSYKEGVQRGTLSPDTKPTLGADDVGYQFYATDFCHLYRWDGSAWDYGDSDECSGFVDWWAQAVPTSRTGAWVVADGSTVTKSTRFGATASITVPDLIGQYVKGAAAYTGTPVAGSTSLTVSGDTGDESAHTHPVSVAGGVTATGATTTINNGAGAPISLPTATHGHALSATGTASAGSAHKHDKGTLTVGGTAEPDHLELIPMYRL